jgi:hypothetical protein
MNKPTTPAIGRRAVFAGAGVAGALATAALVLPAAKQDAPKTADAAKADAAGGYQLTEHVKRYYATARV